MSTKIKLKKGDHVSVPSWAAFEGIVVDIKGKTVYVQVRHEGGFVVKRFYIDSVCPQIHDVIEKKGW